MTLSNHKLLCLLIIICFSFLSLDLYLWWNYETYNVQKAFSQYYYANTLSETELVKCGTYLEREKILPVKNAKAYLVSAYLDERFSPRTLRVIGIVHRFHLPRLYCHVCNGSSVLTMVAEVLIHSDHFGFPYGTTDFVCHFPEEAGPVHAVSISAQRQPDPNSPFLQIRNGERNNTSAHPVRQFSVCISTLFGNYSNVLQFVQSMEMYRILGAQKVFIYKSDCSPLLQRVLDFYSDEGFLQVIPWDIQRHLHVSNTWSPSLGPGDLHYHGQIAALNDCVYRNMHASSYVVLLDTDEVIVPRLHRTWADMMAFLSQRHLGAESFLFENSVFRHDVFGDSGSFNRWPSVPGTNILRHVHREPISQFAFNARKMVVNPLAVVWTSVHSTLWQYGDSLKVPNFVARLHHCRSPDNLRVKRWELVRDTTLWRYSSSLIGNVTRVLRLALHR